MLPTAGMDSRLVHILAYSTVHNLAPQRDPNSLFTYAQTCSVPLASWHSLS